MSVQAMVQQLVSRRLISESMSSHYYTVTPCQLGRAPDAVCEVSRWQTMKTDIRV